MAALRKLIGNAQGATAIEYALIASLIAIAAIGAMTSLGSELNAMYGNVSNSL